MRTLLQEVLPGVHVVSRIEPSGWCFNTILLSIDGDLAVYSPTRKLGDELHARIEQIGRPRWLVAPNHFHHLGLEEWRRRYSDAIVFARPQAIPRLAKMYRSLEIRSIEEMSAPEIAHLEPSGTKNGEVWLVARDAWIVGDAFFNVRPPVSGLTGFILELTGTAPGLTIGRLWAPLHLEDRAAYRSWLLDALTRSPPSWLIPAHGDPISGPDLPERLSALAHRVLR